MLLLRKSYSFELELKLLKFKIFIMLQVCLMTCLPSSHKSQESLKCKSSSYSRGDHCTEKQLIIIIPYSGLFLRVKIFKATAQ